MVKLGWFKYIKYLIILIFKVIYLALVHILNGKIVKMS